MSEVEYIFKDNFIEISKSIINVEGVIYPINSISSISIKESSDPLYSKAYDRCVMLALVGIGIFISGLVLITEIFRKISGSIYSEIGWSEISCFLIILPIISILVYKLFFYYYEKTKELEDDRIIYSIIIISAGKHTSIISRQNKIYIENIKCSMEKAIHQRG